MTAYDVRARATAGRLLVRYGQAITLTRPATGAYDPATGTGSGGSPVVQTTSGAVFEYNTFIRSGLRDEPGSLILAGDKQLLLSPFQSDGVTALSPAPKTNDTVTLASGVTYTITAVAPLSPAGTAIYFECNIRGAS